MSNDPNLNSSDANPPNEVDCTLYADILRGIANSLRAIDFASHGGGLTFVMDAVNQTFCDRTNQRTLERSGEVVNALSYLVMLLLEQFDEPNRIACDLAAIVEQQADEIPEILPMPNIDEMEFQVSIEGFQDVIMSFDELVERMELPLEDFVALTQDLSLLDNVDNIESLFRQIDGE